MGLLLKDPLGGIRQQALQGADTRVESAFSEADRGESVANLLDAFVDGATAPVDTAQVCLVCLGRWDPTSYKEDESDEEKAQDEGGHDLKDADSRPRYGCCGDKEAVGFA